MATSLLCFLFLTFSSALLNSSEVLREQWSNELSASQTIDSNGQQRFKRASALSTGDIQILVDEHNRCRRLVGASNMMKQYWDSQLASNAQAYANLCIFAHSSNRINTGENIWAGRWYQGSIGVVATRWWYNEAEYCRCGNYYTHCCGHYSQVVWANSNRFGCGYAVCPGIRFAPRLRYLLVCHYSPAGNKLVSNGNGQAVSTAAYQSGSPCASCPGGMTCDDGLCA